MSDPIYPWQSFHWQQLAATRERRHHALLLRGQQGIVPGHAVERHVSLHAVDHDAGAVPHVRDLPVDLELVRGGEREGPGGDREVGEVARRSG